jgi:hypothetical protein
MKRFQGVACLMVCAATTAMPAQACADQPRRVQDPIVVPFDLLITKHIVVNVKINGKGPYRVIFDTGAPVTLINTKTAKASGLLSKNGAKSSFSLFGPVAQAKIKSLELGDLKAENVPAIVMDHPTVEIVSQVLGPVEGIIGFPFFARYKMTLDYQAKEMTFVPNDFEPTDIMQAMMLALMTRDKPAAKTLAAAGLWGFLLDRKDDDEAGMPIKQVLPGSAAAKAGLKDGDRLLTLDDRWTDTLADCYSAASYIKPGAEAKIVIKRDGKEMLLVVKPESGL